MAALVVVFDASAIVTYLRGRTGAEQIKAVLSDSNVNVYIHRHNATEVWYQMHRHGALDAFLKANPQRVDPDGRPNLAGCDFDDLSVFDAEAGRAFADASATHIEAAGVRTIGDEIFPELWKRAAELKSKYRRVSLADCFGLSLALQLDATFWTSDRHELEALEQTQVAKIHFFR